MIRMVHLDTTYLDDSLMVLNIVHRTADFAFVVAGGVDVRMYVGPTHDALLVTDDHKMKANAIDQHVTIKDLINCNCTVQWTVSVGLFHWAKI